MTETTVAAAPPPEKAARWEDFVDIFVSPREVFARREDGRFVVPLIFVTLVMVGLFFAMHSALAAVAIAIAIHCRRRSRSPPRSTRSSSAASPKRRRPAAR